MLIKTVIIDDDVKNVDQLNRLLDIDYKDVQVFDVANSIETGINSILKYSPHLVIVNIKLGNFTVFDLLRQLESIHFKIIFMCSNDESTINLLEFNNYNYLVKPIQAQALINTIERVRFEIKAETKKFDKNNEEVSSNRIILKTIDRIYSIPINDIVRCESDGSYTTFHLSNGKKVVVSKNLKEFENTLINNKFFRAHQSHIINIDYLDYYQKNPGGGVIILKDGSTVPLAVSKKNSFLRFISRLIFFQI